MQHANKLEHKIGRTDTQLQQFHQPDKPIYTQYDFLNLSGLQNIPFQQPTVHKQVSHVFLNTTFSNHKTIESTCGLPQK